MVGARIPSRAGVQRRLSLLRDKGVQGLRQLPLPAPGRTPSPALAAEIEAVRAQVAELQTSLAATQEQWQADRRELEYRREVRFTQFDVNAVPASDAPFMAFATPVGSDFSHPRFAEIATILEERLQYHRKLWEWVFIYHTLHEAGVLVPGNRGLGFGVGLEALPSAFAARGCEVLGTDSPEEGNWGASEHSSSRDQLIRPSILAADKHHLVGHRACDMNAIDEDLTDFDFVWSACAFEHLGTIRQGLEFVENSVNHCLKPGGVAVHTTELNVDSETETIDNEGTVLFRQRDLREMLARLRDQGHEVEPLVIGPRDTAVDNYVDSPPWGPLHLKIMVGRYATTSVGVVIRKATG